MEEPKRPSTTSFPAVRPGVVSIETKSGSRYDFPDMDKTEVFKILGPQLLRANDMVLVNLSGSCLTIPVRIISIIAIDDEVTWRAAEQSTP